MEKYIERGRKEVDPRNILNQKRASKPTERATANAGGETGEEKGKRKQRSEDGSDDDGNPRNGRKAKSRKTQERTEKADKKASEVSTPPRRLLFATGAGDAVREDGTYKDASEMEWLNSPSDATAMAGPPVTANPVTPTRAHRRDRRRRRQASTNGEMGDVSDAGEKESGDEGESEDEDEEEAEDEDEGESEDEDEENAGAKKKQRVKDKPKPSDSDAEASETEDEGTKKYYALFKRMGKRKPRKSEETRDLRPFFKANTRMIDNKETPGHYCTECLKDSTIPQRKKFFTGNVSTQRKHITRFHYDAYEESCDARGIETKAQAPKGWKKGSKSKSQQSISKWTEKQQNPLPKPKVTKEGILEYLIELLVDADLSFRFVERASFRRFVLYINPKLKDTDIPHKTSVANAIKEKGEHLETVDFEIIQNISSLITLVYDGWSTKNRKNYTGIGIQYIDSEKGNDNSWKIRRCLLVFEPSPARHTGKAIGKELLEVVRKYHMENKLGWTVGDNLTANDVGIRYLCRKLNKDGRGKPLDPKEVRGRCISHAIHLGPCHFIKALNVPGINTVKRNLRKKKGKAPDDPGLDGDGTEIEEVGAERDGDGHDSSSSDEDDDGEDDEFDIEISMEVEADMSNQSDYDAVHIVDFEPGDVIGKLLAFINQIRGCSESARNYFELVCHLVKIIPKTLKLWVRTRWGSLDDCLETALYVQKAIDRFCSTADFEDSIPKLRNGKRWRDYLLTADEWKIISLSHRVLNVAAKTHARLSADRSPTLQYVYPILEKLLSEWEEMAKLAEFQPIKHAIDAGLENLTKWYRSTDDIGAYFVAHLLDPVRKDRYVKCAWEKKYVKNAMEKFRSVYLDYKIDYDAECRAKQRSLNKQTASNSAPSRPPDMEDDWMDAMQASHHNSDSEDGDSGAAFRDDFAELNKYLAMQTVSRKDCPDPVAWWGHHGSEFPVLRKMARDYLAIPASSALIERAFSMSARTDDPRRRNMGGLKFGMVQKLRDAYREGRLEAAREAWVKIDPDFNFFDDIAEIVELLEV